MAARMPALRPRRNFRMSSPSSSVFVFDDDAHAQDRGAVFGKLQHVELYAGGFDLRHLLVHVGDDAVPPALQQRLPLGASGGELHHPDLPFQAVGVQNAGSIAWSPPPAVTATDFPTRPAGVVTPCLAGIATAIGWIWSSPKPP